MDNQMLCGRILNVIKSVSSKVTWESYNNKILIRLGEELVIINFWIGFILYFPDEDDETKTPFGLYSLNWSDELKEIVENLKGMKELL